MEVVFPTGKMSLISAALVLLAIASFPPPVDCNEDCLWYVDKNGTWRNGFDCPLISSCCGNCHRRYCCMDPFKIITEREQKRCMLFQFSPSTLVGIASSILLFVAIIATMVCCFMCSCCYLYQMRQQRSRTPYDAQNIPMASYPVEPMHDVYGKPLGAGYPMAPQYPGMSVHYPMMHPGPYPSQSMDPTYSQAPPPYSPPQYLGHWWAHLLTKTRLRERTVWEGEGDSRCCRCMTGLTHPIKNNTKTHQASGFNVGKRRHFNLDFCSRFIRIVMLRSIGSNASRILFRKLNLDSFRQVSRRASRHPTGEEVSPEDGAHWLTGNQSRRTQPVIHSFLCVKGEKTLNLFHVCWI